MFVHATYVYIGYFIPYKCLNLLPGWFAIWQTHIVMEFDLLCSYISALITLGKTYGKIFYWLSYRLLWTWHGCIVSCTFVFFDSVWSVLTFFPRSDIQKEVESFFQSTIHTHICPYIRCLPPTGIIYIF